MKLKKPSRAAVILTVVMAAFLSATIFAQFADARSEDATTAKLITKMITQFHISQGKIDDEVSGKMFDRYIEQLDNRKMYFTKADIEKFKASRTSLDDQVKEGNVQFAYDVFKLYRARVTERLAEAKKWVDPSKHDFTLNETLVVDADSIAWSDSKTDMAERWRKRVKADILTLKLDDQKDDQIIDRLTKRYRGIVRAVKQMENHEILEIYLSSLTHAFDPHSSYMSPQTVEDFQIIMRNRLQGIGATLGSEDGYTIVRNVVEGGAAHAQGDLKVGDRIIAVDQHADGNWTDVVEMKLTKVVRLIRGQAGTKLKLKVKKADKIDKKTKEKTVGKTIVIDLTRKVIQLKSMDVQGRIIDTKDRIKQGSTRIGVVWIPSFYRDFDGARRGDPDFKSTSRDVKKVLADFKKQGGIDLLVIDLRDNGGGALTEAIEVSGLFIDKGPVVQVKTLDGAPRTHDDTESGTAYNGPLMVICDKRSASASEIFAGVIKDYKRGIIVGDSTTHGKGTVQNVMPVGGRLFRFLKPKQRGALKLTIQQFYRVNGDSTQRKGVPSDIVLPSLRDYTHEGEAALDNALKFSQVAAATYDKVGMINGKMIARMKAASAARVKEDSGFQKTKKRIVRFLKLKNRKTISLNEKIRRKELAEAKAIEQVKAEDDTDATKKKEIFVKSHYNDEVLRIGVDYISLIKSLKTAGK